MQKEKILVVDDSEMNRSILEDMLNDEFDIVEAEDGIRAIDLLQKQGNRFTLVLLDIVMPRMDGFGVLEVMNKTHLIEEVPVIMVSAETASSQIERAYELGATDFIMRPFDASIVRRRVVNTILLYGKQKKLISVIEEQIYEKEQSNSLMVEILSHIVEFRNGESGLHIRHVKTLTDFLLHKLCGKNDRYPMSESEMSIICMASALHDIGKIGIEESILNKPGKLTPEEFARMKEHSLIGAKMLEDLPYQSDNLLVKHAYEICRWHHERYDGNGYPDGLKGDAIPISAQIVALADVYDALTSERIYKKALEHAKAVEMILDGKCGAFNPLLLKCLEENSNEIRDALKQESQEKRTRREIRSFADAVLHSHGSGVSERTLKLLDYERMKYDFYAAMTEEIQFEYSAAADLLKLSPFGAMKFGVEENIINPAGNEKLKALLGADWFDNLAKVFADLTPEHPEYKHECKIMVGGELRWHNVIIRAIFNDDIPPKIESAIGKAVDVHDAHTKFNELKENAMRDPLTGLLNRTAAREQIERRILNYPNHKYAFATFDVDFFKNANDVYGHLFGDKVLIHVAERMNHSVRASDLCARIGGDEFLLFFEYDTNIEPIIARIFKNLCCKIENFDLTVSMGVAEMTAVGQTYTEIFHRADLALYYSKKSGRARFSIFDENIMSDVLEECDSSEVGTCCSQIDEPTIPSDDENNNKENG